MKRWELSILIGLVLAIFTTSITGFAQQCSAVRGATVRLHILANSDSERDQALKLQVRDAVLDSVEDTLARAATREEALALAEQSLPSVERTARETLRANGCTDDVRAEIVNMYFATRKYDNGVVMPAGRYDAVRILIGEGAGRNWWCVMFPPLCLPAAEPDKAADESAEQGEAAAAVDGKPAQAEAAAGQPSGFPTQSQSEAAQETPAQRLGEQVLLHEKPEYEVKFAVVEAYERIKEYFTHGTGAFA